jgi:hypothetical protein
MLGVIMIRVIILCVVILNVIYKPSILSVNMLIVIYKPSMLSVLLLNVVMLSIIRLSVAAPFRSLANHLLNM